MKSTTTEATSFASMLAILFIGLKLTGYIAWSWLWVLSPLWIPVTVVLAIAAIIFLWYKWPTKNG